MYFCSENEFLKQLINYYSLKNLHMEANKIQDWNRTTEAIYKNVMLLTIAGIAAAVFGMIPLLGWLSKICNICVVAGYIAFYIRLKDLELLADPNDAPGVNKLCIGVLLYILGIMLKEIPVAGWILCPICLIISFIFMLLGYSALKKSETFPGKDGMKLLFISSIIGLVAAVFGLIPLLGTVVAGILYIAVFVLVLLGWKKVATPVTE